MTGETLFVGIGSDHGDDRAGWLVAEALAGWNFPDATIRCAKSPIEILDWLDGIRILGICDACEGAGRGGSWHRWKWPTVDAQFVRPSGTHSYGLLETLRLGAQLGLLPEVVLLWGIEIASDRPEVNVGPAPEVEEAVCEVARDVASALRFCQPAGVLARLAEPSRSQGVRHA